MSRIILLLALSFLHFPLDGDTRSELTVSSTRDIRRIMKRPGASYKIAGEIDLRGDTLVIPANSQLVFESRACFKNGTLVGDCTGMAYYDNIFDNVEIAGTWNVPVISTGMFSSLEDVNSLKNVFALSDGSVRNEIKILKGQYKVSCPENKSSALTVKSNTNLIIEGEIVLQPNSFEDYDVIGVINAVNVELSGHGQICGDKGSHMGTSGEWGMGIGIKHSSDVTVRGLNVSNCWGDCIYVALESRNIHISSCNLVNARRQGISVVGCVNCSIDNCSISNISGTKPETAIDLEPNPQCVVSKVLIENVSVYDCVGGFLCYGGAKDCILSGIQIKNCRIVGHKGHSPAIQLESATDVTVSGCTIAADGTYAVFCAECNTVIVMDNSISTRNNTFSIYRRNTKGKFLLSGNRIDSDKFKINSLAFL